ncbi:MAG TPA: hypothetical protein VIM73_20015, partial [Polyangiaceae bacterium]
MPQFSARSARRRPAHIAEASARAWVTLSAAGAFAIGTALLVAWLSGNPDAVRFAAWRGKTNAAIALMLASGGLLAARHGRPRLANGLGSSCSALGLATLLEYVMRVDFGIDQWLARDWVFAESA